MKEFEDRNASLTAALRAVAEDDAREETMAASAAVEARLMAEVQSIARARRRRTYATVLALAAVLALAIAWPVWRMTPGRPSTSAGTTPARASSGEVATEFFPLIYGSVPITNGQIVRLEVPRRSLARFGLASFDSLDGSASATVPADVLVGEDGLARAVRFIRPAIHKE